MALVPALIRVKVIIPRHAENRAFCVAAVVDGEAVRRVCRKLDGEDAEFAHYIEWRDLAEPGEYVIVANLYRGRDYLRPFATTTTPLELR